MAKNTKDLLLVMDVGNTNTVLGVYQGKKMACDWRIRTEKDGTLDEMGILISNLFASRSFEMDRVYDAIISCVVPPMVNTLEEFVRRYFGLWRPPAEPLPGEPVSVACTAWNYGDDPVRPSLPRLSQKSCLQWLYSAIAG